MKKRTYVIHDGIEIKLINPKGNHQCKFRVSTDSRYYNEKQNIRGRYTDHKKPVLSHHLMNLIESQSQQTADVYAFTLRKRVNTRLH